MSVLENFYNGNIAPIEEVIPPDADYRPLAKEIGDEREYFTGILSAEDRERFGKWNKSIFKYEEMIEFANFTYGFRLGAMLEAEIFTGGKTDKGMENKGKLLDILVNTRTVKALDEAVSESDDYRNALKKQDKAFDRLEQAGLSGEQKSIVDRAISAANECGAVYGAVAYRLGLYDGIRFIKELKEIK